MRSSKALFASALWLCLAPPALHAQSLLPPVGQRVSGRVSVFDRQFPLPPGDWRISAAGYARVSGADPGAYGAIGDVLLLPVDAAAPYAFALIRTNALPVRGGWGA